MDEMYDEAIDVVDAEDVPSMSSRSKSPESSRANMKTPRPQSESRLGMVLRAGEQLMAEGHMRQGRVATLDSDMSDNTDEQEDDDDDIVQAPIIEGAYDPKDYEHLPVSSEVKELFQYITLSLLPCCGCVEALQKDFQAAISLEIATALDHVVCWALSYTPQTIQLDYKLEPFVPDYIPSVGEIDSFIKVPRPDGVDDKLGLVVLDEPCADQTEPAVMHLQLRASAKQSSAKPIVVKQVEDPAKNPKAIEKWIKDIQELHRSKPPPAVHYSNLMPDIDNLMEAWPPDFEQKLNQLGLPLESLETDLPSYIDIILALFDIPKYGSRIESLHVLFTLYSAIKNYKNEEREAAPTPNP